MRFQFDKLVSRYCLATGYQLRHIPHIWYDPKLFRRYFCRGDHE